MGSAKQLRYVSGAARGAPHWVTFVLAETLLLVLGMKENWEEERVQAVLESTAIQNLF